MGKGSRTHQNNVIKRTQSLSSNAGAVGAGGGSYAPEDVKTCLFTVEITLQDIDTSQLETGQQVTLVRSEDNGVDIFVENKWFDTYTGKLRTRIADCMSSGFVYTGKVGKISGSKVTMTVTGHGAV